MGMMRLVGLFALIPAAVLLTISFFVLVVLRKLDTQGLKTFGYVVAVLLWVAAALVISAGAYTTASGDFCPMYKMMMKGSLPPMMMGPR